MFLESVAVLANQRLAPRYHLLTLESPNIAAHAAAGRFVSLRCRPSYDPLLRRPMGIYRVLPDPRGRRSAFQVVVQELGRGTQALVSARAGERLSCAGPLGNAFTLPREIEPASAEADRPALQALLIAGGIGISPFHLWAEELLRRGVAAELLYGGRSAADLVCLEHFRALGFPVAPATEDGSLGYRGRVTELLERRLADRSKGAAVLYACGPEAMLARVQQIAGAAGVRAQLCLDRMMCCAAGVCLSCVVGVRDGELRYRRVCTEGPVFEAEGLEL